MSSHKKPATEKTSPTLQQPSKADNRCLGPVSDLEKHLPPEWWRSLFNSLYIKTDADVVENQLNTITEVDMIVELAKLTPSSSVLDLCCGQGRHTLELARRGYASVVGIDRSRYLIRLARKRALQMGMPYIKFSEGDARKIRQPSESFDCVVLMGNSFGYFENENDDLGVANEICRLLKPEGKLILDITDGEWMKGCFYPRSWEWIDQNLLVCRERSLSSDNSRLISREVIIDSEKGAVADQFYAERLYTYEVLKKLLESVGFQYVAIERKLEAHSTRNQDVGMMAKRILITAQAPKKVSSTRTLKKHINCTVLLGDPRLTDPVKRDGRFNQEDIETVQRLKEALNHLHRFSFTYLDDHSQMMQILLRNRPALVFNLCDEGFNNDPNRELHIPSWLEMYNIPYTGSSPTCLAICYDKSLVRAIAKELEIPVPLEIWIDPSNQSVALPDVFPAMVKPSMGDSSVGIDQQSVVHNAEELVDSFNLLKTKHPNTPIIVQEFLSGREFTVAVIGNRPNLEILGILEVDYSKLDKSLPPILGYESKWLINSPYWNQIHYHSAKVSEDDYRALSDASLLLFERLECKDYARFDFRADAKGVIKLLEVNPNPGWCWDGKFNMIAGYAGLDYPRMLEKVLANSMERMGM